MKPCVSYVKMDVKQSMTHVNSSCDNVTSLCVVPKGWKITDILCKTLDGASLYRPNQNYALSLVKWGYDYAWTSVILWSVFNKVSRLYTRQFCRPIFLKLCKQLQAKIYYNVTSSPIFKFHKSVNCLQIFTRFLPGQIFLKIWYRPKKMACVKHPLYPNIRVFESSFSAPETHPSLKSQP